MNFTALAQEVLRRAVLRPADVPPTLADLLAMRLELHYFGLLNRNSLLTHEPSRLCLLFAQQQFNPEPLRGISFMPHPSSEHIMTTNEVLEVITPIVGAHRARAVHSAPAGEVICITRCAQKPDEDSGVIAFRKQQEKVYESFFFATEGNSVPLSDIKSLTIVSEDPQFDPHNGRADATGHAWITLPAPSGQTQKPRISWA